MKEKNIFYFYENRVNKMIYKPSDNNWNVKLY